MNVINLELIQNNVADDMKELGVEQRSLNEAIEEAEEQFQIDLEREEAAQNYHLSQEAIGLDGKIQYHPEEPAEDIDKAPEPKNEQDQEGGQEGENADKPKQFRLNCKQLLLTYPRCPVPKHELAK